MRRPYTELYLHLVWSTWRRYPFITPELRPQVYAVMHGQCKALGAEVIAIGGIEDHVHVLLRFPTTVTVSTLVQRAKGASSHLVTQVLRHPDPFKWQGAYGAFTVSKRGVRIVQDYVLNQERHHREGTIIPALERIEE